MFCRHNRLEVNCPICSRELAAARPASRPRRTVTATRHVSATPAARGPRPAGPGAS